VAVPNGALFEWDHYAPPLIDAGTSDEVLKAVRDETVDIIQKVNEGVLSPAAGTIIRYTDAMTRNVSAPDDIFTAAQQCYNSQEIVEITATVVAYNCVSRFLVALDVAEKQKESTISI
jgi:alkylhydroperoxidase family enzyme